MDLSGIFIVTVPTLKTDYISGFGKVVIIISVFNKSALRKIYGFHIAAAAYSPCLYKHGLYLNIVKPSFIRHYIMRHFFK